MKKFLLLSNYAPKPDYKYSSTNCPLKHRVQAHDRIYALERYWPEGVLWQTINVEDFDYETLEKKVFNEMWDAIWLSGSPYSLEDATENPWIFNIQKLSTKLLECHQPVIGLCLGLQLLAVAAGGSIIKRRTHKKGEMSILNAAGQKLVKTIADHKNYVGNLPPSVKVLGSSECGLPYLIQFNKKVLGIQSHPEHILKSIPEQIKSEKFWGDFFKKVVS